MPAQRNRKPHKESLTALKPNPTLKCVITSGTFSNDLLVRCELPDGGAISAVVDKSDVTISHYDHGIGIGFLKVRVKVEAGALAIVELPRAAINGIREFEIPRMLIQNNPLTDGYRRRRPRQLHVKPRTNERHVKAKRESFLSSLGRAR